MYWNGMLKLYFYFLQIVLKIQSCQKSAENKSSVDLSKLTNYVICFLLSFVFVKIFYENCQN